MLPDIQNETDHREIPLAKVGVKGLEYPVRVLDKAKKVQHTSAKVDLFANLPHHFKGTHMSRFVEIFHNYREDLSMPRFLDMLFQIKDELKAESAFGRLEFPYYIEKNAPVSNLPGIVAYHCRYQGAVGNLPTPRGERRPNNEQPTPRGGPSPNSTFTVAVSIPVSTVCPCSRAISERGAHNQRGVVTVELELGPFFWIEDIIQLVEACASSPVYATIKREDEKFITERGYDNPRFVEDLVREVYARIRDLGHFPHFSVEAENFESIHNHSAYAYASFDA